MEKLTLDYIISRNPDIDIVETKAPDNRRAVKSYVLRGQRLAKYELEALYYHFDDHAITYTPEFMDFKQIFGNDHDVVIEIGFGMGESTIRIAKENPDINYIGFEVFLVGFSRVLAKIEQEKLSNLKIMRFDAKEALAAMIPDGSIKGFHIFFPDPWPKLKHHGRRLIQAPFVDLLQSKLKTGGYIYAVTDWQDYADQMLSVLKSCENLQNKYYGFADPIPWRPSTSFERKGLSKDYRINELWFEKK